MIDVIERLQKAETRPLDADGKTQLWETLQDARAEIARLRDALDEQTGRAGWNYECLIQRDAQVARLRLTDEELENIDLAIQQLPYGAARVKVVLYEIMQRYGFQRDRSGGTQGR